MAKQSEAAKHLWSQIFARAAELPNATMHDPSYQSDESRESTQTKAFLEAGWSEQEIAKFIAATREYALEANLNSPGVGPGLEATLRRLSDRILLELAAMGETMFDRIEIAIDPKIGISASLINVPMTEEAILTVSSFLFRWCGLIARAYTRTLMNDVLYWTGATASKNDDMLFVLRQPDIAVYWIKIFLSFAGSGTHAFVPYRPSTRDEIHLMEQIAWSMEYFTVAHEYGHHILSHRSVYADPIEQEYEADAFALRVCDRLVMEPFNFDNPYIRTGAGPTLMLKSLETLSLIDEEGKKQKYDTHPPTDDRIRRILNRHVVQPDQLRMDHEFNYTVLRIMKAVENLLGKFLNLGGRDLVRNMKELER
jgi:hypothetical protein